MSGENCVRRDILSVMRSLDPPWLCLSPNPPSYTFSSRQNSVILYHSGVFVDSFLNKPNISFIPQSFTSVFILTDI